MCVRPKWVKKLFRQLDEIQSDIQYLRLIIDRNEIRDQRRNKADIERDGVIMAQVQVAQEQLDEVVTKVGSVIEVLNGIDLSELPEGDFTAINTALNDLATAANRFETTENVPDPSPEPGPVEPVEPTE